MIDQLKCAALGVVVVMTAVAAPVGPSGEVVAARAAGDGGAVTGLPLPRFVSLKASKANVRRGPGLSHRLDWVFLRRGMPLQIVAEHAHWRKVRDVDDATGWIHYSLLRADRTALVRAEQSQLREEPDDGAATVAIAEEGVIVALDACTSDWCAATAEGHTGWIMKSEIWGVGEEETFE